MKANKLKFENCWKVNCTPPIEVYEKFINFFGTNIDIEDFSKTIDHYQRHLDFAEQALEIWKQKFKTKEQE